MKSYDFDLTQIGKSELRALLFWAAVGVSTSRGGSYDDLIEEVLVEYSKRMKIVLPKLKFKKPRKPMKRDYRTWWRDWENDGAIIPNTGMIGIIGQFVEYIGGWQEVIDIEFGYDITQIDCALEQYRAIREGLTDQ